ncbi:uncharacterized protein LOC135463408 [Liolophura sinensis]|uniref:uncharacterized protein LOC135463408 n=1 Tax=Liolophura sinensis TaxID=3198878 RepID=UPI00315981D5
MHMASDSNISLSFTNLPIPRLCERGCDEREKMKVRKITVLTADVEDVSFIAESLRCLPDVASLSFLRHEFLAGNKLFLPILKACMLHERLLSALDRREQQYHTPNLCTGCIRSGLCYGCDKAAMPHYHMDKVAKTGGGFTYYKRDRPGNLMEGKDPRNWSSRFRREFQELAKQMASLGSPAEVDENGTNDKRPLSLIPDFSRQPALPDISDLGLGTDEDADTAGLQSGDEDKEANVGEVSMADLIKPHGVLKYTEAPSTTRDSGMDDSSVCAKLSEVADLQDVIPQGFGPEVFSFQGWVTEGEEFPKGDYQNDEKNVGKLPLYLQRRLHTNSPGGEELAGLDGTSLTVSQPFDVHNFDIHNFDIHNFDEQARNEVERSDSEQCSDGKDRGLRTRDRQRLYKGPGENAPPAFKLKSREKKEIVSRSPFSTDRQLDVPTGEGFMVKKSNKKLTEFTEFNRSGQNWKEPKKFELQENVRKTTEFWSPPSKGEKRKTRRRLPNKPKPASPVVPDNSVVSPDSGLESEKFQVEIPQRLLDSLSHHGYSIPDDRLPKKDTKETGRFWNSYFSNSDEGSPIQIPQRLLDSLDQHVYSISGDLLSKDYMKETGRFWNSYFSNIDEGLSPVQIQQRLLHSWDQHGDSIPDECLPKAMKESRHSLNSYFNDEGSLSSIATDMESDVFETPLGSSKTSENSQRSLDSLNSIGTPPDHDSPGLPLTSPDFDLSLADIGEEVLPLTYVDPIQVIDSSKMRKLRKKRRKRSKRLASDEQMEQVDVDDIEVKVENAEGDEQKAEQTELNMDFEASKRYMLKVGEPLSEHESPEEDTSMLMVQSAENDGDQTNVVVIPTDSPLASADSLETPHTISRQNSHESETRTNSTSVYDAFSRTNSTVSGGRGRISRLKSTGNMSTVSSGNRTSVSSCQEKRKPVIRSPEKIFTGLDDELLRKLPSIKVQLEKLGVDLDAWKEGRRSKNSDVETALLDNSEKGTDFLSVVSKCPVHSRPSSSSSNRARSPRLSARKMEEQDAGTKSANNLPSIQQEAISGEHCASKLSKVPLKEDTSKDTCGTEIETIKDSSTDDTPPPEPPASAKPKRPVLKRQKKGVVRKVVKPPSPKLPEIKPPPSVKPLSDDSVKSLTPPSSQSDLSPLPPIEPPELPDFIFPESKPKPQRIKTMIATPSPVVTKEVKKTRKPPPKVRKQVKIKHAKRSVAEAPVTREELQQATDPLDFLAKYCIIHKDRLPLYQRVFQKAVSQQSPKYQREITPPVSSRDTPRDNSAVSTAMNDGGLPNGIVGNGGEQPQYVPQLSPHEMKMLHDLTVINRAPSVMTTGVSPAEEYLDKLKFSFELLHDKQIKLKNQLKELDARRLNIIATKAKEMFPDMLSSNGEKKTKKKSAKKSGKKSSQSRQSKEVLFSQASSPVEENAPETPTPPMVDPNSDVGILQRLSNKAFDAVCATSEVVRVEVEIERGEEKLQNVMVRLEELQAETSIVKLYCMEYFFQSEMQMTKPKDFLRQQSGLYNSLHPTPDTEINMSEVGPALQMINNNLLTNKEMEYLFHILNLPGRTRINFHLFSVLAALSERVAQLDPLVKKLINKLNYEALDIKMEKCKELFALLHDGEYLPGGRASASTLAVELTAGGLTPEHTAYVLSKFDRDGSGVIDFMDFVTYVPLFIEIHQRIVDDPLRLDLDL